MRVRNVIRVLVLVAGCALAYVAYDMRREAALAPLRQKAARSIVPLARMLDQSDTDQEIGDWVSVCTANPFRDPRDRGHATLGEDIYRRHLWDLDDGIKGLQQSGALDQMVEPQSQLATRLNEFGSWVAGAKMQREFYNCRDDKTPRTLRWLSQADGTFKTCLNALWRTSIDGPTTVRRPDLSECERQLAALPTIDAALASGATAAASGWRVTSVPFGQLHPGDSISEVALDPTNQRRAEFVVSPNGARVAFVVKRGAQYLVVIDGQEGRPYDNIWGAPLFSADSRHVAYHARDSRGSVLVVDGREGPPCRNVLWFGFSPSAARLAFLAYANDAWHTVVDGVEQALAGTPLTPNVVFSPDATRFAYVHADDAQRVVVDGRPGASFDAILVPGPRFSPDSAHVTYAARRGGQLFVVVDDQEWPALDGLAATDLVFSPDSAHLAFVAKQGARQVVVLDGQPGTAFDAVGYLTFSANSQRLAYWGMRNSEHFVVLDGRQSVPYAVVTEPGPRFSPDSRHLGYAATQAGKARVVIDGKDGPLYDSIAGGSPVFSPDSARVAYVAAANRQALAVIDGRESPAYERISGNVQFSPDSTRTAFVAKRDAHWHVVLNGEHGDGYDAIEAPSVRFSADSRHVAFVVERDTRGLQRSIVLDGRLQQPYFALDTSSFTFGPDSAHSAYFAWNGGWRMVIDGGVTQESVGAFLPGTAPVFTAADEIIALGRTLPDGDVVQLRAASLSTTPPTAVAPAAAP